MENELNLYCCACTDETGHIDYYVIASDPDSCRIIIMTKGYTFMLAMKLFDRFSNPIYAANLIEQDKHLGIDNGSRILSDDGKTITTFINQRDNGYFVMPLDEGYTVEMNVIAKKKITCVQ